MQTEAVSGFIGVPVREAGFATLTHLNGVHGWALAILPVEGGVEITARRGDEAYQLTGRSIGQIAPYLALVCGCSR